MPDRSIDWLRWLLYLLAGVPLVMWVFFTRDRVLRVIGLIGVMLFAQDLFVGRRYFWAFSLGPSLMTVYVGLMARVLENRKPPPLGTYGVLWLGLLFFASFGVVVGSLGTPLLQLNVKHLQLGYIEGFFFFTFGLVALRRPEELQRFFRLFVLLGAGVALVHFFTQATGYRFRGVTQSDDAIYYGAVFNNTNSLGSFYVLVIPVALVMVMRSRLTPLMRSLTIGSLVLMIGSLILTGSRGGLLCTVLMCGIAMVYAQLGAGRALMAMVAGAVLAMVAFLTMSTLLSDSWSQLSMIMREEGLESNRLSTWFHYGRMLAGNPFGVGLTGENLIRAVGRYGLHGVSSAHNIYLDIAVQIGIFGLIIFLVIAASVLNGNRRVMRIAADPAAREGLTFLFLALVGYLLVGVVEPIYTVESKLNTLYWLLAGLSVGAARVVMAEQRAARAGERDSEREAPLALPAHARRV
jgi:O-antigen ligase